ncbi:antibiotic biosynthesis monooxygenase [Geodermatophilus sp. URMC 64]
MHVRSTTVLADPRAIDAGVAFLRQNVMPTLEKTPGCVGLSMLADRESGRCIAATAWETEEAMRATAERLRPVRNRFALALGGSDADVREWEVGVVHRDRPAGDGAGAQVAWARVQPNHVDDLLEAYRANLMPRLQELPGFCSVSLLVDRRNGRTVSVTAFEDRDAASLARKQARHLREQFAQAMGARIVDVAEMDLALAHLRTPETP